MGLFGTMANWLSKYGGRNGTESSQNYNSTSYGAIGALGNGYSVEVPYVAPQYVSPNNNKTNESFRNTQSAKDQSFWEGKIDTDTTNRLFQRLEEIRNQGRTTIEYTYKCVKCREETKTYLDPAMFVFVVLQSLVFKIGNQ